MEGVVRTAMPRQSRKGSDRHQPKQFSKAKDGCGLARLGGRVLVWVGEGRGAEREREMQGAGRGVAGRSTGRGQGEGSLRATELLQENL